MTPAGYNQPTVDSGSWFLRKNVGQYSVTIIRAQAYKNQAAVVQSLDSVIYWINLYPVYNAIGLIVLVSGRNLLLSKYTFPLDRDLSGG